MNCKCEECRRWMFPGHFGGYVFPYYDYKEPAPLCDRCFSKWKFPEDAGK